MVHVCKNVSNIHYFMHKPGSLNRSDSISPITMRKHATLTTVVAIGMTVQANPGRFRTNGNRPWFYRYFRECSPQDINQWHVVNQCLSDNHTILSYSWICFLGTLDLRFLTISVTRGQFCSQSIMTTQTRARRQFRKYMKTSYHLER